jgi:hypothetical protein
MIVYSIDHVIVIFFSNSLAVLEVFNITNAEARAERRTRGPVRNETND